MTGGKRKNPKKKEKGEGGDCQRGFLHVTSSLLPIAHMPKDVKKGKKRERGGGGFFFFYGSFYDSRHL